MPTIFLVAALTGSCAYQASADEGRVTGCIGSHRLTFRAREIADEAVFTVKGRPDYLAITEVYPDTPDAVSYSYTVSAPGIGTYERSRKSSGFGPVTYFIKSDKRPVGKVKISRAAESPTHPVRIASVRGVREAELKTLLDNDNFRLMGMVPAADPEEKRRHADLLASGLRGSPEHHITTGVGWEIYYARHNPAALSSELAICKKWSDENKLPILLGLVSWWAGTPGGVPDGLGGTFTDLKYQQVCYSPEVEMPENTELKSLLGDRFDPHYGLSIPNHWSNTPWLTMNSRALNDYRFRRLDEAVELIKETSSGDQSWLCGVFLENEPRYWDTQSEEGNPKAGRQGKTLWADFNPLTIEAARADGVDLNPADGLSNHELSWLHRNVGRYCQDTVDSVRKSLTERRFGAGLPVYTHSLLYPGFRFPGGPINHSSSEWAYADGARTGIEGIWTQPADLYRVREWGRWANLNREETVDPGEVELDLWDLRVAYMMGSDLYNSYNWQLFGQQRFFDYVNEFLGSLPVVSLSPAKCDFAGPDSIRTTLPAKLQAFTSVELPVQVGKAFRGMVRMIATNEDGESFPSSLEAVDLKPGVHSLAFEFATPAECRCRRREMILRLRVYDANGQSQTSAAPVRFTADSAAKAGLSLDLRAQRALSLWAIARART